MAKFILQGTILEEPNRKTVGKSGLDCVSIKLEEKYETGYKEIVNVFEIEFFGKCTKAIPTNVKLAGCPVVIGGNIASKTYKDKLYFSLTGTEFTLITLNSFNEKPKAISQEKIDEVKDKKVDDSAVADDNLPF